MYGDPAAVVQKIGVEDFAALSGGSVSGANNPLMRQYQAVDNFASMP